MGVRRERRAGPNPMSERTSHRGADPEDERLFAPGALEALRLAGADLCWLLSRDYNGTSALKLVGDRYRLAARQRMAVVRSSCPDRALAGRLERRLSIDTLAGTPLRVDGLNLLTTVEGALGGAVIVRGREGCYRDLIGVHGNYRKVEETVPAAVLTGELLESVGAGAVTWLLDRPVSNSGRLAALLRDTAERRGWDWRVELPFNPDAELRVKGSPIASADAAVIDGGGEWVNLSRAVIDARARAAWVVGFFEDL
jgi:hypothetical protein